MNANRSASPDVKVESPLNQVDLSDLRQTPMLQISEHPQFGYIVLRARPHDDAVSAACQSVLGVDLPQSANTLASSNQVDVLWTGPTEWLVVIDRAQLDETVAALKTALADIHSSVVDVSGGNTMIELRGEKARALLAKGSPFDFHPSRLALGECVQTVLAKATATIYPIEQGHSFRVIFRRSFADYLGVWLLDASREFVQD